jgi:hypothetical protein
VTAAEIARRLAERAEQICAMLLPAGRRDKGQWLAGDAYGGRGDSLKVTLTGPHAGQWRDWGRPEHRGDLLDLWRIARGIDAAAARREARAFLGVPAAAPGPGHLEDKRKPAEKPSSLHDKAKAAARAGWPAFAQPTAREIAAIARLRDLSPEGVALAAQRGLLFCATWARRRAWVVSDATRFNAQARGLDGAIWEEKDTKARRSPAASAIGPSA